MQERGNQGYGAWSMEHGCDGTLVHLVLKQCDDRRLQAPRERGEKGCQGYLLT